MIEARSKAMSELLKALWANLNSAYNSKEYGEKMGEAIKALWDDPDHVYNSMELIRIVFLGHLIPKQRPIPEINGENLGYYANHFNVPSVEHNMIVKILMIIYSI